MGRRPIIKSSYHLTCTRLALLLTPSLLHPTLGVIYAQGLTVLKQKDFGSKHSLHHTLHVSSFISSFIMR